MEIKFIATLVIALLNIFLGIFILKKNPKNPGNVYFCGLCVSGGIWALTMAWLLVINNQAALNVDLKLTYIFGILPPFFYLMFAYHYPYKLWLYSRKVIGLIYFLTTFFLLLVSVGWFNLEDSSVVDGLVRQSAIFPNFLIFAIYFFFYIIWGLIILIKKYKNIEGVFKVNLKYLIAATISTFIITGITSVIMPIFDSFSFDWLGPIFTLVHFTTVGYLLFYKLKN